VRLTSKGRPCGYFWLPGDSDMDSDVDVGKSKDAEPLPTLPPRPALGCCTKTIAKALDCRASVYRVSYGDIPRKQRPVRPAGAGSRGATPVGLTVRRAFNHEAGLGGRRPCALVSFGRSGNTSGALGWRR
jgi:hypothetical protein